MNETGAAPGPEITEMQCPRCGIHISGLDGRYQCGGCQWVNSWADGHRPLPTVAVAGGDRSA